MERVADVSEKDRKERLAEQLRANIRRRKAQSHASRGGKADRRSGLPAAEDGHATAKEGTGSPRPKGDS
nr:hypothetical protein [Notoacmeibacter marinus]